MNIKRMRLRTVAAGFALLCAGAVLGSLATAQARPMLIRLPYSVHVKLTDGPLPEQGTVRLIGPQTVDAQTVNGVAKFPALKPGKYKVLFSSTNYASPEATMENQLIAFKTPD